MPRIKKLRGRGMLAGKGVDYAKVIFKVDMGQDMVMPVAKEPEVEQDYRIVVKLQGTLQEQSMVALEHAESCFYYNQGFAKMSVRTDNYIFYYERGPMNTAILLDIQYGQKVRKHPQEKVPSAREKFHMWAPASLPKHSPKRERKWGSKN